MHEPALAAAEADCIPASSEYPKAGAFPPAPPLPPKPSPEEKVLLDLVSGLRAEISELHASELEAHAEHIEISGRVVGYGMPPPQPPPQLPPPQKLAMAAAPAAAGLRSFTTLGMPAPDVKAKVALEEAEHFDQLAKPFTPRINEASANLRRSVPVHEMLLGKAAATKQKLERTAAQLNEEEQRMARSRSHPKPRCTDELAQRYSERVGQSARERLHAPRQLTLERARQNEQERSSVRASPRSLADLMHCAL